MILIMIQSNTIFFIFHFRNFFSSCEEKLFYSCKKKKFIVARFFYSCKIFFIEMLPGWSREMKVFFMFAKKKVYISVSVRSRQMTFL